VRGARENPTAAGKPPARRQPRRCTAAAAIVARAIRLLPRCHSVTRRLQSRCHGAPARGPEEIRVRLFCRLSAPACHWHRGRTGSAPGRRPAAGRWAALREPDSRLGGNPPAPSSHFSPAWRQISCQAGDYSVTRTPAPPPRQQHQAPSPSPSRRILHVQVFRSLQVPCCYRCRRRPFMLGLRGRSDFTCDRPKRRLRPRR
jgi:hypothetical protein